MNKRSFLAHREYFEMVHGVTMRAIRAFSNEDLDFRPTPSVRTPRELIFHIYTQEKTLAEAAQRGEFTAEAADRSNPESAAASRDVKSLITVDDVSAYAAACHQAANDIATALSDDDLARPVASPFGTYPAWRYFGFGYDEHWHHRGQLYTYLRLLGKEPPMLYDYSAVAS